MASWSIYTITWQYHGSTIAYGFKGNYENKRELKIRHVITLAPMNLSFSTIQESKKTKALLQQNRAETSVAVSFFKASKYR